ncbi:MAG: hypothetical protein H8E37_06685 [Planctomycetes bacterium]|nr:hypothetical protein [Planctomycetota bacterium]
MQATELQQTTDGHRVFEDRRKGGSSTRTDGTERRQFQDSRNSGNPDAIELAEAIDHYKLSRRRRFITYEELHAVITELGYTKLP